MCRPIESSCATGVPNVTALLGAYQRHHAKDPGRLERMCGPPPLHGAATSVAPPGGVAHPAGSPSGFNVPPPPLSFMMMAPSVPAMPSWMHAAVDNAPPAFLSSIGLVTPEAAAAELEAKVEEWDDQDKAQVTEEKNDDDDDDNLHQVESDNGQDDEGEAAELEDLLDFTKAEEDDLQGCADDDYSLHVDHEKDVKELDDCFDDQEMSILYSFLVDPPEGKSKPPVRDDAYNSEDDDDGLLHLNLLEGLSPDMLSKIMAPPPMEIAARTPSPAARSVPKRERDVGVGSSEKRLARRASKRARHSGLQRRLLGKVGADSVNESVMHSTSGDPGGRVGLKG